MAKNRKKKAKNKADYEVGYGKPPKEYQWEKGCKSPNPKGRPKKIQTMKEALQVYLTKEITTKNEKGEIKKITCLEALVSKTIADAISKDGPTRRLLYRQDLINLVSKEQDVEYSTEEQKINEVESKYGEFLHRWAETDPKLRDEATRMLSETLREVLNERYLEGGNHE